MVSGVETELSLESYPPILKDTCEVWAVHARTQTLNLKCGGERGGKDKDCGIVFHKLMKQLESTSLTNSSSKCATLLNGATTMISKLVTYQ